MGVKFSVKKVISPSICGSYTSIIHAITYPYTTASDIFDISRIPCGQNEFSAIRYNSCSSLCGTEAPVSVDPFFTVPSWILYIVNGDGSINDTFNNPTGGFGRTNLAIPSTAPFYIVIENTGGEFCDDFDIEINQEPI
jgi:hypothetical protein